VLQKDVTSGLAANLDAISIENLDSPTADEARKGFLFVRRGQLDRYARIERRWLGIGPSHTRV
jgi:hypothetical protein